MRNLILFLSLLLFFSCEKVIEVDLDDAEEQIVIEGVLTDKLFSSFVSISRSGKIFEEGEFERIDSAKVEIRDQNDSLYQFLRFAPGIYSNPSFRAREGYAYTLHVETEDGEYSSIAETPVKVALDTAYLELDEERFIDSLIRVKFRDAPVPGNYYRIITYRNGERTDGYNYLSDELSNGEEFSLILSPFEMQAGDEVVVEFLSCSKEYYDYINILATVSGNPFSAAPGNPPSNIAGEEAVQGYFGVFRVDRDTLHIE